MTEKGQSLFELLVAIFVVGAVLISLVSLSTRSVSETSFAESRSEAGRLTQEGIEWVRGQRDAGWDAFVSHGSVGNNVTWCINSLGWTTRRECGTNEFVDQIYKREIILTVVDATKSVDVEVLTYWTDPSGRHESRVSSTLTNWK